MDYKLHLVVDLDGTFLEGELIDRLALYTLIECQRNLINLIYCTGRCISDINNVIQDDVTPTPNIIIADVGTTIHSKNNNTSISKIQKEIQKMWPGHDTVSNAFDTLEYLELQPLDFINRRSYTLHDKTKLNILRDKAAQINCDLLYSHDKFIDILPQNVNKGTTLLKLIQVLNINPYSVLTAGDTMNDYSMFTIGVAGIVVNNASPSLKKNVRGLKNIYLAKHKGTKGILEGISHFDFQLFTKKSGIDHHNIIAYHRPQYSTVLKKNKLIHNKHTSPNGIIPTLKSSIDIQENTAWVCTIPYHLNTKPDFIKTGFICEKTNKVDFIYILEKEENINDYYHNFSKNILWPTLHSYNPSTEFHQSSWINFLKINFRFAISIAMYANFNSITTFHDYNLWMAPYLLRQLRPDITIKFFHHTPFPQSHFFSRLPCAKAILKSLSCCNRVDFHTTEHLQNYIHTLELFHKIKEISTSTSSRYDKAPNQLTISHSKKSIQLGSSKLITTCNANPVGIDTNKINSYLLKRDPDYFNQLKLNTHKSQQLILTVQRMDYTKGIKEKLQGIEQYLSSHSHCFEKIKFILIIVPPHKHMRGYDDIINYTLKKISYINGTYGSLAWTPVRFIYKNIPYLNLIDLYAISDIMLISSTADGLNLVAKEFVAVKKLTKRPGALILSRYAGSAQELHNSLIINPFDKNDICSAIEKALDMTDHEKHKMINTLATPVFKYDIHHWIKQLILD